MVMNSIGNGGMSDSGKVGGDMTMVPSDIGIMTKMLSSKLTMGVITALVIAIGIVLGIVLAKKKIKKGLEM